MDGFSPSATYELGFGEVGGSKHIKRISGHGLKRALSQEYSMYATLMERSIVSLILGLLLLGQRLPPNISGT